jgi:hypothetical protein
MALPEHLVEQYWGEVTLLLGEKHGLTETEARDEVTEYRNLVVPLTGDVTYNKSDPPDMAARLAKFHRRGGTRSVLSVIQNQPNGRVKN